MVILNLHFTILNEMKHVGRHLRPFEVHYAVWAPQRNSNGPPLYLSKMESKSFFINILNVYRTQFEAAIIVLDSRLKDRHDLSTSDINIDLMPLTLIPALHIRSNDITCCSGKASR